MLSKEGSDFSSKKPTKFGALGLFSKVPTKNQPFGFNFSKDDNNKLSVRNPAIFGGGGAERIKTGTSLPLIACCSYCTWVVPYSVLICNARKVLLEGHSQKRFRKR